MPQDPGPSVKGDQVYDEHERSIEPQSKVGARGSRAGPYEGWTMDVRERDADLLRALLKH
jgi:hypothetical protein